MKLVKNLTNLSIVVKWDALDDFLPTGYTVNWNKRSDQTQAIILSEQTSYTITGLTLDTVYTITVTAANMCGDGPKFRTSVSFPTGIVLRTFTNLYSYTDTISI